MGRILSSRPYKKLPTSNWRRDDSFLCIPSIFYSFVRKLIASDLCIVAPLFQRFTLAFNCNPYGNRSIFSLLLNGSPPAIFFRIPFRSVDSIDRCVWRLLSHVSQKNKKIIPFLTDCDSLFNIVSNRRPCFCLATASHTFPSHICSGLFSGFTVTMLKISRGFTQ